MDQGLQHPDDEEARGEEDAARALARQELDQEPLAAIERLWSQYPVTGRDICDFEAALVRLGKDYCRKGRDDACPFRDICGKEGQQS